MMMLIFILLLITVLIASFGLRRTALCSFGVTLVVGIIVLASMVSHVPLQF